MVTLVSGIMSHARAFVVMGIVVASLAVSGCFGNKPSDGVFHATGANPMLMPANGPYDGSGVQPLKGTMLIHTMDATNDGYVDVDLTMPDGKALKVHWTKFAIQPNANWQDGGIASNVVEHGASGHGNKMEPQLDLQSGGWGSAEVTLGGDPLVDPVNGGTSWNAHYMLTKEAMMDPATHAVYKDAAKSAPYDPKSPGEGYVIPNKLEMHFGLWSAGAFKDGYFQTVTPNATKLTDTVTDPQYSKSYDINVNSPTTNLTLAPKLTGGVGKLTFTLKDPSGKDVATADVTPVAPAPGQLAIPKGPLTVGVYKLAVTGTGVEGAYGVEVANSPPSPVWIHVVFADVKIGD